jgi:hypothetical protein
MSKRTKIARTVVVRVRDTGAVHYRRAFSRSEAEASVRKELTPELDASWATEDELLRIGRDGIAVPDLTKDAAS